jgi:hypothetical protein
VPLVTLVLGLAACGVEIPEERQPYVGQWDAPDRSLRIDADGIVAYERRGNPGRVTLNGPIREFRGDDFVVGLPLLNTSFEVSRPPWRENGRWWMIVDGVVLVREQP